MSINSPNSGVFQCQLSNAIVAVRNDFQTIANLYNYITAEGGVTFLENVIGLSAADAATVMSTLGNHYALSLIYQGGAPQGAFNYQSNGQALWGGM